MLEKVYPFLLQISTPLYERRHLSALHAAIQLSKPPKKSCLQIPEIKVALHFSAAIDWFVVGNI